MVVNGSGSYPIGGRWSALRQAALCALLATVLAAAGCGASDSGTRSAVPGGIPERGRRLAAEYGCGACHRIPGVDRANGTLGPPLDFWSRRAVVAGVLPNTPPYLMRWIMTPQAVVPGNAMPDLGVGQRDAADIAAYLYTIR